MMEITRMRVISHRRPSAEKSKHHLTKLVALSACYSALMIGCVANNDNDLQSGSVVPEEGQCGELDPCPVSIYAVLSNPELWDGNYIWVVGYVSYGAAPAVFADQFSSDNAILGNGIELSIKPHSGDDLAKATDVVRPVHGIFRRRPLAREGHLMTWKKHQFIGTILNAQIVPYARDAWSCETASERIKAEYQRRGEPCVAREIMRDGPPPVSFPD